MYWANFLHVYQPPTQKEYWVKRVSEESYRKVFKGLLKSPNARLTLNITGVLLELLEKYECADVIDDLRKLVANGQIELTGSAKFHALLPFLPESEIIRQIQLNEKTLRHYFGADLKLKGFFPPEMAFSSKLLPILAKLGYEWIIVDEMSFPRGKEIHYDRIYEAAGKAKIKMFFRERRMSWVILSGQVGTGKLLVESLGSRLKKNEYLLTAMDGETFGHHRPGLENLLFEIYDSKLLAAKTISELPDLFPKREVVTAQPATWALMEKDLQSKQPFSRWKDKGNSIHALQWKLTDLTLKTVEGSAKNPGYKKSRALLDMALHSDQYWWASARPWWSIEMIERGAKDLMQSIKLLKPSTPAIKSAQAKGQEFYNQILYTAFDWQRSGKVDQLSHEEDEDVRQRTDRGLPQLPKAEIDKMVSELKKEMAAVVGHQEFERASQIRDRIAELNRYISSNAVNGKVKTSKPGLQEFKLAE